MAGQQEWRTYDEFAYGIDTNRLPRSDKLAGQELRVTFNDGSSFEYRFKDVSTCEWRTVVGPGAGASGTDRYEAVEVDDGVYFIDATFQARPREALTVIANLRTRRALAVFSVVAEKETPGEPRVQQRFHTGTVGDPSIPPEGPEPAPTRDLIGKRALYRYSPNHLYEHIYLSSKRYCWQCLVGVQRGHGDSDLATTYKFDEGRYVFTFREFRIPVASVFFYNMDKLRSTGKFLGVTADGAIENNPAGAYIIPLGTTKYPDGVEPV
jgi:hypothetical protein